MFGTTQATFTSVICSFMGLINSLIWLLSGIAIVIFMFGLVRFVMHGGDEKAHKDGKQLIVWGLTSLFIIFSLSGILLFLSTTFLGGASNYQAGFNACAGAGTGNLSSIQNFIVTVGHVIESLIPISIGCAMVAFFWGLIKYIREPERKEGVRVMIAGIVSLFIMVSVWGIIALIQNAILGSTTPNIQINAPHL